VGYKNLYISGMEPIFRKEVRDTDTKIRLCGETEGADGVTVKSIVGKKVRLGTGTCPTFMF